MEYCIIVSEGKINKVIENLYSDPKYQYHKYNKRFRSKDGHYYIQAFFESFQDVKFRREDDRGETICQEIMSVEQFRVMVEREEWLEEENENGKKNLEERIEVNNLDFPFLLYHNEMIKANILPENYVASKLKQIAKRLEGLIGNTPLSELKFLVTYHYYKDFEYFMNSKRIILGMKSNIEEIKLKDMCLYNMILNSR
jgi:hypothetical protein